MAAGRSYDRYVHTPSRAGVLLSAVLVGIVCLGAVTFLVRPDPFWFSIAFLTVLTASVPALYQGDIGRITAWWVLLPVSAAFIANIVGIAAGLDPLSMSSPIGWAVTGVSLFALCWTLMAMIDGRGRMSLRPQYLAASAFAFFEAVVVIQGWLSYISDQGLGTHLVPSNFTFMAFFVLCTIAGAVFAIFVRHVGRPRRDAS